MEELGTIRRELQAVGEPMIPSYRDAQRPRAARRESFQTQGLALIR
jgi:hypothetical protein